LNIQKIGILFFGGLFLCLMAFNEFGEANSFEKAIKNAEQNLARFQEDFDQITNDQILLDKITSYKLSFEEINALNRQDNFLYIYQDDELIFWNKNSTIPETFPSSIADDGSLLVQKNGFYFALKKDFGNYQIVALQLIKNNYPIANKYLANNFVAPYEFKSSTKLLPLEAATGEVIYSKLGKPLFSVVQDKTPSKEAAIVPLILGYLSLICFWFFLYYATKMIAQRVSYLYAFAFLICMSFVFLMLVNFVDFEFKKTILFSPELYASQYYGQSLGDLLFYSLVVFVISGGIAYFFYYRRLQFNQFSYILFTAFLFLFFLLINLVIKSLILDSVISFELNNITQTTLYTLVGLFIFAFALFSFIIYLYIWIYSSYTLYGSKSYYLNFALAFLSMFMLFLFKFSFVSLLYPLGFAVLSSAYLFLLLNRKFYTRFNYILITLFFTSLIGASMLSYYNLSKADFQKATIANQISKNNDLITEYRFELIQKDIKADPFIKKFFISPFISQEDVQQRLTYIYFNGYLSKYNVNALAFNLEGKAIKTADSTLLSSYYDILNENAEETFSEWLFLIPKENGKNNYLSILPIENNGAISGNLVIELNPKTYQRENLYPELLIEQQTNPITDYSSKEEYDYGVYKHNYLISQTGEYPFPYYYGVFNASADFPLVQNIKNFRLNFFETDKETKVVMSSPRISVLTSISTLSYIFSFFGILLLFIYLLFQIVNYKLGQKNVFAINFTFKNRISFAITSITVASFIIVGIVTIGYFSQLYIVKNTDNLIKKQKLVLSSLEYYIEKKAQEGSNELPSNLGTELATLAEIQGIDINIFSLEGNLLLSSQPGVFGNGLVSRKINPVANFNLSELRTERYILDEAIGKLIYKSVYVPIRSKKGEAVAILNLPYFAQKETLRSELSNLMVALVNVYVLLLLVSILLAVIVSSSITRPLANISQKFSMVNLDAKNEPIQWEANDEIGVLVKEYNKMILQIEESASIMAQSERESAWREMAKQIAHEIKNPLTPMKLGIQHLQRAIQERPDEVNELATKVSKTMIEQIENLAEIANAFSSFAKMPAANKEVVNLVEILQNVVDLFQQSKETVLSFNKPLNEALIYADKNQLLSVFNNLVKNALQATEEKMDAKVHIELALEGLNYKIKITDNGLGIAEDKKHKVFVPNFTTKSSGTGLGLAISKQIVENNRGVIWFESMENNGATFYVTLPKYLEK
jgi:two-component system, NtrC family, nitrogen regulation sensor histidine kinase NtrY